MELVHINFLTVESGKGDKEVNILVVTDHFTGYVQTYVIPSQTAKAIAQILLDRHFIHYGLPEKIVSDQSHNLKMFPGTMYYLTDQEALYETILATN